MKTIAIATASAFLTFAGMAAGDQQTPTTTTSQNSQDVPHQQPSTSNPDVGKQRHPTPAPESGSSQPSADVPRQQPSTSNPDVGKQRHPKPKTNKRKKSTASSTQP